MALISSRAKFSNSFRRTDATGSTTENAPLVYVMRETMAASQTVASVLMDQGHRTECLESGDDYLAKQAHTGPCCIVLDLFLSGSVDGLALQRHLSNHGDETPLVFYTSDGSVKLAVRALKAGAVDFLTDSSSKQDLLEAVEFALTRSADQRTSRHQVVELQRLFSSLTQREYQVIGQVALGKLNKQIAADFDIAEKTVKVHRAHAVTKLGIESVAELVAMVCALNADGHGSLPPAPEGLNGESIYPARLGSLWPAASGHPGKAMAQKAEHRSCGEMPFMP